MSSGDSALTARLDLIRSGKRHSALLVHHDRRGNLEVRDVRKEGQCTQTLGLALSQRDGASLDSPTLEQLPNVHPIFLGDLLDRGVFQERLSVRLLAREWGVASDEDAVLFHKRDELVVG